MVYDVNGIQTNNVYDVDGASLSYAYDVEGNEVLSGEPRPDITVMSYNVQHFENFNGQQTMQEEIIDTYQADIIGFQEFSTTASVPTVGANVLGDYPRKVLSNHTNYMALVSKINLSNTVIADFENQDPYDIETYRETRAYMKANITVKNKTITWINTHLAPHTAEYKYAQMGEIFDLAESADYVIITGDFNAYCAEIGDTEYTNLYKPFVDAGYKLVNCTAETGITKTWTNKTNATSLSDFNHPCDNIIVSSNIDILSATFDTTKLSYLNGQAIDHIPIIVELKLT